MAPYERQTVKGDQTYHGQMDQSTKSGKRTRRNIDATKNSTHLVYTQIPNGQYRTCGKEITVNITSRM